MSPSLPATPSTALRVLAALTPPAITGLVCIVAFLVAGPRDAIMMLQEAGIGAWLVAASALVGSIAAGVLVAVGPGLRAPSAIVIAVGTWPWLAGLAGASWGAAQVESALAYADPAMRATLMAQGLSEALLGRVLGGVAGGALLAGIALGLAIASVAPRAPNRSAIGAVGGLVAGGLALGVGAAFAALEGGLGGAALLVGIAMIVALACAVAGWGAGADEPHARAASLAAASPVAGALALAAAGAAAATLPVIDVFGAIATVEPGSRLELLAAFGDEVQLPAALATHGWAIGLLACAVLVGWAASRARPTSGRIAGAAAILFVAIVTIALGRAGERSTYALLEAPTPTPWDAVAGFEPVLASGRGADWRGAPEPALIVGVDRVVSRSGQSAPLAGIDSPGPARDAVAGLFAEALAGSGEPGSTHRPPFDLGDGPERGSDEPGTAIAIDARVTGSVLRSIVAIAEEQGARSIDLVGVAQRADAPTLARIPPEVRGLASAIDLRADRAVLGATAAAEAASDPRLLHGRIVPAHEQTAVTLEGRPGTEGETIPALVEPPAWQPPSSDVPLDGRSRVYLTIDPATHASTVASVVARVRAAGHVPVLLAGDEIPGSPSQPAAPTETAGLGSLGLTGTGDGSGTTGVGMLGAVGGLGRPGTIGRGSSPPPGARTESGSPEVLGSLSADVVRRVVRQHIGQIRHCYEQRLVEAPTLEGRVVVAFTIGTSGSVREAHIGSSTLDDPQVEQCLARAIHHWTFPAPEGGGIVRVSYPFVFSASP